MRFVEIKNEKYRVGLRNGWLIVSLHENGRLQPGFVVCKVNFCSEDALVAAIKCGEIDLEREIEMSKMKKAG